MSIASGQKRCDVELIFEVKLSGVKRWKKGDFEKRWRTPSFTPMPVKGKGRPKAPKTPQRPPKKRRRPLG